MRLRYFLHFQAADMERFRRQEQLEGFGPEAQLKLNSSSVLVIGIGGLGCPVAQYLAAAGIGRLGLMDGDFVKEHNLNRQILFGYADIGRNKAQAAAERLKRDYPELQLEVIANFAGPGNMPVVLEGYDMIVDATDDFGSRYLINDAAVYLDKSWVFGALHRFEFQIACFNTTCSSPTYRDLFPEPPPMFSIPACDEQGVLGTVAGTAGLLMAQEVVMRCSGAGSSLGDHLLLLDMKSYRTYTTVIPLRPQSREAIPSDKEDFRKYSLYQTCFPAPNLSWSQALKLADTRSVTWIDIRTSEEREHEPGVGSLHYPGDLLLQQLDQLHEYTYFVFCRSGARSRRVVSRLKALRPGIEIYSIDGGLNALG